MLDIAPTVHLMCADCKSSLLAAALIEQTDNASHVLRAVCTPDAESMFWGLGEWYSEPEATSVLAGLKHVGFSDDGKTAESLAKKEDGRMLPNEKQACWRETEAESAFNGSLLTGSRDAILSASWPPRRIPDHNSNRIRQKQIVNAHILLGSFRFMWQVVQDMLDE